MESSYSNDEKTQVCKKQERNAFLFIAIVLFPLLSVVLVGGMGFLIWITQIIFGPPSA